MHKMLPGYFVLLLPVVAILQLSSSEPSLLAWSCLLAALSLACVFSIGAMFGNLLKSMAPLWFFAPIFVWHWIFFSTEPSPAILEVLSHTDLPEARGFLTSKAGIALIGGCIFYWVGYWLVLRSPHWGIYLSRNIRSNLLAGSLAGFAVLLNGRVIPPATYSQIWPNGLVAFTIEVLFSPRAPALQHMKFGAYSAGQEEKTIVLVIGESTRASSLSLLGYSRDTTPLLAARQQKDPGLFVLSQAYSTANLTYPAVRMMLTGVEPDNFYTKKDTGTVLDLFREAGYHISWISNNDNGVAEESGVVADYTVSLFRPGLSTKNMDEDLLPYFDRALSIPKSKKLIVLHCIGSHFYYRDRYPGRFGIWNEGERDEYDNTIRYFDFFLESTIEKLALRQEQTVLFYLSDHGENLLADGNGLWGHGQGKGSREEFHVAGIVWVNSPWYKANLKKAQALQAHSNLHFMQEDTPTTLASMAGISYPKYSQDRDLVSPAYHAHKRQRVILSGRVASSPDN